MENVTTSSVDPDGFAGRVAPHGGKRLRVTGTVQGVGFRPYVYGLATRRGLTGFVLNDARGVLIEVHGPANILAGFRKELLAGSPPLARIEDVTEEDIEGVVSVDFRIETSRSTGVSSTPISADVATCADCVSEVFDPQSRRYRYAFTNCTNCGPRYTITKSVPYDRPTTTMARFDMCDTCRAEYDDPRDRRFHAQPIACPDCGPCLSIFDPGRVPLPGDPLEVAAAVLDKGGVVAIKGLGGFHFACDATSEPAVRRLRERKSREERPLAIMVADIAGAQAVAHVDEQGMTLLRDNAAPIVLLESQASGGLAPSVAPGNRSVGVMLPYSPLHHLLLAALDRPLVLTSGNRTDEPIAFENDDAFDRLGDIADAFLSHDRPIHIRCDDSVVLPARNGAFPVRRSRGYAPQPLTLDSFFDDPVLAVGGELKNTICIGAQQRAIVSHHIGDLENWATMRSFVSAIEHLSRMHDVKPAVIAHDLHPDYLSTKWALDQDGVERVGVQHHHAHVAACLADNRRSDRVIGVALDGSGFGEDGAVWGCEVLIADRGLSERRGHLDYLPLPGGVAAIKNPWRMGAVYLERAFGAEARKLDLPFVARTSSRWEPILQIAKEGINSPPTSSAGRLFDAVAAICGVRDVVTYEGQAAAELEQVADPAVDMAYDCPVALGIIDGVGLVRWVVEDLVAGVDVPTVAASFHNGLALGLARACEEVRRGTGLSTVALSGGAFQNVVLLTRAAAELETRGFEVLTHRRVPPNDGGLSLGQAVVAQQRLQKG
ncbi:MAG: carbamoyltransferase HypF [Actinomycetota bacterium]|nr:carbamoyltransferase HypF [Actinomycetota bacterium]